MARLYKSSDQYTSQKGSTWYEAISDKPVSNEFGSNRGYPVARMNVMVTKSTADPNWNMRENLTIDNDEVRARYDQVSKETGIQDIHRVSSGRMLTEAYNAVRSAETLAALKGTDRILKMYGTANAENLIKENVPARHEAGIQYAKSIRNIKNLSSQLFDVTPQKAEVWSAFSHSSMRHMIPLMGALAHQEYGELTSSDDLSQHSSRLTKHAQAKGLPVKTHERNKDAKIKNAYTFDDTNMVSWGGGPTNLDSVEVPGGIRSAKMAYKALRGVQSAKTSSPQFEQLRLPGME